MKIALWIVSIVAATIVVLGIFVIGPYVYLFVASGDRTIAKNISVGPESSEVKIQPGVRPTQNHQGIDLEIEGVKFDSQSHDLKIRLPDGSIVQPEIELLDDQGESFPMKHVGFGSGPMSKYDDIEFWPKDSLLETSTYTTLRIRADQPFTCYRIDWVDYNPE